MTSAIKRIKQVIGKVQPEMRFLRWLFGQHEAAILNGEPFILFGTGNLGRDMLATLKNHGAAPVCFCDSNPNRVGSIYHALPVISTEELKRRHSESFIVIASQTYAADIKKALINLGFDKGKIIWPSDFDMASALFFTPTNQATINRGKDPAEWMDFIENNSENIEKAYSLFEDDKSRRVFIEKIAAMVNYDNIQAFSDFLMRNSEPVRDFGLICFRPYGAENFYYFNNDIYHVQDEEVYVDVGAHDGDSVIEFIQACTNNNRKYKKIIAFEPDPDYFRQLSTYCKDHRGIQCVNSGIWSESAQLKFKSSSSQIVDGSASIDANGDVEISVISLDDFLSGERVTLIKMDPPGNIISKALEGAKQTIEKHKPKLVLGAYHSASAIFEVPLLVHSLDPNYRLYLRHNSWGIGETDLYAIQ